MERRQHRQAGPSTKCEFFNGKVRGIHVDEDGDLYLLSTDWREGSRTVHASYVECPADSWVVANGGGRCYRECEVRENFVESVKCPQCTKRDRWFGSETAYRQHWNSIHRTP